MIKNLLITYLFLITNVFAGLPPTTVKGQAEAVKTTTFNVEVPYSQATTTAAGTRLLEVGNNNILANGSFEHSTYDTGWTCSLGTKTKETTTVFKGKNSMKIVSAGAGTRCYIYSTTDAAKLKGQQGHATVRVNSTDSVLQVCALAGGTTSAFDTNCVTVPVTTTEAPWKTIVIPTIMDGTGNGVVIKSAETLTKTVFIDEVEYKHGLPVQAVNGARLVGTVTVTGCASGWNTSSATFASFGAQTGCTYTTTGSAIAPSTNIPAIKFASLPAGDYRLEYEGILATSASGTSGFFQFSDGINTARESSTVYAGSSTSQSPGLQQSISYSNTQSNITLEIKGKSTSGSAVIYGTTSFPGVIKVWYFPPVSTIYSQASRDFGYTNAGTITITATTTNPTKGTVVTDRVFASRDGQRLIAEYQYEQSAAGSAGSGDYLFTLPSGLSFDTNIVGLHTGTLLSVSNSAKAIVGSARCSDAATATQGGYLIAYDSTRFRVACNYTGNTAFVGSGNWGLNQSNIGYALKLNAPIQGWTDSGVIVGSFEGIEKCANAYECTSEFTAYISTTGVVTNENVDWINGNCTVPTGTQRSCTYNTNLKDGVNPLSSPMNCTASAKTGTGYTSSAFVLAPTSTGFIFNSGYATNGELQDIMVDCQKTGADYKPKTAKIASSIGVPTVPGVTTEAIDTFSVSYGTTNATTACSASPCSYLDQIGSAVTSVTRSGTGSYSINTAKTYTKLKCNINSSSPSGTGVSAGVRCENCNSITFYSTNVNVAGIPFFDTYGTLHCQGSY